jgi:hemoglobin-like flavoprotein
MAALTNPIQRSFELAAERCDDLTPLVYRRLFHEHPEAETMFRSEGSDLVKGSMLALTIDAILDFAGDRTGRFRMIECEVSSHDAYGTPRELFVAFFGVIAGTLHDMLDTDWSPEIDVAICLMRSRASLRRTRHRSEALAVGRRPTNERLQIARFFRTHLTNAPQ